MTDIFLYPKLLLFPSLRQIVTLCRVLCRRPSGTGFGPRASFRSGSEGEPTLHQPSASRELCAALRAAAHRSARERIQAAVISQIGEAANIAPAELQAPPPCTAARPARQGDPTGTRAGLARRGLRC